MEKGFSFALLGCSGILFFTFGCGPELAQVPVGEEEKAWDKVLKDNYYSYRPPHTPAPASYQPQAQQNTPAMTKTPAEAAADPAAVVDRAAAGESTALPETEKKPAAPVVKSEVKKAEEKEVTAPAEKKEEKTVTASAEKKEEKAATASSPALVGGKYCKPYIVKSGDTLGKISLHFYGNSGMEEVIFNANSKVITDRNKLRPGMRLVIPEL